MPKAIDMHVHPGTPEYVLEAGGEFHRHAFECLGGALETTTAEGMAELYRRLDVMAVVYAWDAETATGLPRVSNDYVAQLVRDFPDVFLGFACVDPWKGVMAIKELAGERPGGLAAAGSAHGGSPSRAAGLFR